MTYYTFIAAIIISGAICWFFCFLFRDVKNVRKSSFGPIINKYYTDKFEPPSMKITYFTFYILCIASSISCVIALGAMSKGANIFAMNTGQSPNIGNGVYLLNNFTNETISFLNTFVPTIGFTGVAFIAWIGIEFLLKSQSRDLVLKNFQNTGGILLGLIMAQTLFTFLQTDASPQAPFDGANALVCALFGISPRFSYYANNNFSEVWKYFTGDSNDSSYFELTKIMGGDTSTFDAYKSMHAHGFKDSLTILNTKYYSIFCWILYGLEMDVKSTSLWLDKLILKEWVGDDYTNVLSALQINRATKLEKIMSLADGQKNSKAENGKLWDSISELVDIDIFKTRTLESYEATVKDQLEKLKNIDNELYNSLSRNTDSAKTQNENAVADSTTQSAKNPKNTPKSQGSKNNTVVSKSTNVSASND